MGARTINPLLDVHGHYNMRVVNPYSFAAAGGGFVPTDIAGCNLWLRADGISGLSNGDPIATWADESGLSNDASGVSGKEPEYVTNSLNGLPVARFNGSKCLLMNASLVVAQPLTIFFVLANVTDGSAPNENEIFISGGGTGFMLVYYDTDQNPKLFGGSGFVDSTTPMAAPTVLCTVWDGGSSKIRQDGVQTAGTGNPGGGAISGGLVGAFGNQVQNFMNADLAEMIVYDTNLSSGDITTVESYLTTKYGL